MVSELNGDNEMVSNESPVPGLIFIASVAGAGVDWRYVRAGGKRSSRREPRSDPEKA
jgi:hypothetical protein